MKLCHIKTLKKLQEFLQLHLPGTLLMPANESGKTPMFPHKNGKYTIDDVYSVMIWDDTFKGKDINDMILNGADVEHITIVLEKRTFSGLEARVELMKWKKCD